MTPSANAADQRRRTLPHVVADCDPAAVGAFAAQQPGERGTDVGDEGLVDLLTDQTTHVVGLDDTAYRGGGPGHGGSPDREGLLAASLSVRTRRYGRPFDVSPSDPARRAGVRGAGPRWWADARPPPSSRHPGQARARRRSDRRIRSSARRTGSSRPSRTASARAIRSSSSTNSGSGPAWRTSSQPRGAVIRLAWPTHRSHECGSRTVASGPTTAVESEYTNVNVATANRGHAGREQRRGTFTP